MARNPPNLPTPAWKLTSSVRCEVCGKRYGSFVHIDYNVWRCWECRGA